MHAQNIKVSNLKSNSKLSLVFPFLKSSCIISDNLISCHYMYNNNIKMEVLEFSV